jgi:crotonobetainyl-CoA:carnitine CoA-transferase CaiB-like acyl-CoA transferase
LVRLAATERAAERDWSPQADRPLAGLRVLDLTRVLAGPVASRFLAGFGASVLRIDPPDWNEPAIVPEVTLGKRCARLDLRDDGGRAIFESLLAQADLLLCGYRSDALDRLGYDDAARRALAPGLIDVRLDAYGWSGPWARRRGFDSLVQMSSGIAEAGMRWKAANEPVPLPVQALDHATGYLIAAAAIRGVTLRLTRGRGAQARLSLARTAKWLTDEGEGVSSPPFAPENEGDVSPAIEVTAWGEARRLIPPLAIDGISMRWDSPAAELGSSKPAWN